MSFITVDGENLIAQQQGLGQPLVIDRFVLGYVDSLGAEPNDRVHTDLEPEEVMAELEVTRSGYVNDNQVVYSLLIDSTVGDFDFNVVQLLASDDTVVAVHHLAEAQHKFKTNGTTLGNNLVRNFLLAYSGITATTSITITAETWQIDFAARLLGIDERQRLSNFDRYGQAGFFDDAFKLSRVATSSVYNIEAGVAYVGGVRVVSDGTVQLTVAPDNSVFIDVSLQGDVSDMAAAVAYTISDDESGYTDELGFDHYVVKLADINASGNVIDARTSADGIAEHLADTDPHPQYNVETATETAEGVAEVATQSETDSGSLDNRIVTPKKLRWGFSALFAQNGYLFFPSWLGGFALQWGYTESITTTSNTFNFLTPFATACFGVWVQDHGTVGGNTTYHAVTNVLPESFDVNAMHSYGSAAYYFAVGK